MATLQVELRGQGMRELWRTLQRWVVRQEYGEQQQEIDRNEKSRDEQAMAYSAGGVKVGCAGGEGHAWRRSCELSHVVKG